MKYSIFDRFECCWVVIPVLCIEEVKCIVCFRSTFCTFCLIFFLPSRVLASYIFFFFFHFAVKGRVFACGQIYVVLLRMNSVDGGKIFILDRQCKFTNKKRIWFIRKNFSSLWRECFKLLNFVCKHSTMQCL